MDLVGEYHSCRQCPARQMVRDAAQGSRLGGKGSKQVLRPRELAGLVGESRRQLTLDFGKPALGAYSWTIPLERRVDAETRIKWEATVER